MTVQTQQFIELSDIVAVRCVCKRQGCGATIVLPAIGNFNKALNLCPKCQEFWCEQVDTSRDPSVDRFVGALNQLRKAQEQLGFSLTLQINVPEPPSLATKERK